MRIFATSASGTAFKQLDIFWENTYNSEARLTEAYFKYSATHVHPTLFSLYVHGTHELRLFKQFCDTAATAKNYLYQPTLPIPIARGERVRLYCTASPTSVAYIAGMNIEV